MCNILLPVGTAVAGSILTALIFYIVRLRHVSGEVNEHDRLAANRNQDLETWVVDDHEKVKRELKAATVKRSSEGLLYSGIHGVDLSTVKKEALHRYRDQEREARRFIDDLVARENWAHAVYRRWRNKSVPTLVARELVQPVLDKWREKMWEVPPGVEPPEVEDPTRRTVDDVITELNAP